MTHRVWITTVQTPEDGSQLDPAAETDRLNKQIAPPDLESGRPQVEIGEWVDITAKRNDDSRWPSVTVHQQSLDHLRVTAEDFARQVPVEVIRQIAALKVSPQNPLPRLQQWEAYTANTDCTNPTDPRFEVARDRLIGLEGLQHQPVDYPEVVTPPEVTEQDLTALSESLSLGFNGDEVTINVDTPRGSASLGIRQIYNLGLVVVQTLLDRAEGESETIYSPVSVRHQEQVDGKKVRTFDAKYGDVVVNE